METMRWHSCRRLLSLGLRQASSRCRNPGPPRALRLPRLLTGCASGSRRSLDGFRSPCLTLSFARHLVPPCMGHPTKLRTLGLIYIGYTYEYWIVLLYSTCCNASRYSTVLYCTVLSGQSGTVRVLCCRQKCQVMLNC